MEKKIKVTSTCPYAEEDFKIDYSSFGKVKPSKPQCKYLAGGHFCNFEHKNKRNIRPQKCFFSIFSNAIRFNIEEIIKENKEVGGANLLSYRLFANLKQFTKDYRLYHKKKIRLPNYLEHKFRGCSGAKKRIFSLRLEKEEEK